MNEAQGYPKEVVEAVNQGIVDLYTKGVVEHACGICYNVLFSYIHLRYLYPTHSLYAGYLDYLISDWPKHTGDDEFPVPAPEVMGCDHRRVYYGSTDKWSGAYGKLREELLSYLYHKVTK